MFAPTFCRRRAQTWLQQKMRAKMQLSDICVPPQAQFRGSIVVRISACHAEDPGSIPGRGVASLPYALVFSSACDVKGSAPGFANKRHAKQSLQHFQTATMLNNSSLHANTQAASPSGAKPCNHVALKAGNVQELAPPPRSPPRISDCVPSWQPHCSRASPR